MTPEAAARLLGVHADASEQEILLAFRRRARHTHPDRFAGAPQSEVDAATADFIRACQARDVLVVVARRPRQRVSSTGGVYFTAPPPGGRSRSFAAEADGFAPASPPSASSPSDPASSRSAWSGSAPSGPPPAAPPRSASPRSAPSLFGPPSFAPPPDPAARRPRLLSRGAKAALWVSLTALGTVLLLVFVVAALGSNQPDPPGDRAAIPAVPYSLAPDAGGAGPAGAATSPASSDPEPAPADVYGGVSHVETSSGAVCVAEVSCWQWKLTSPTDCATALVSIGFSASAAADTVFTREFATPLHANAPYALTVQNPPAGYGYASIDGIECVTNIDRLAGSTAVFDRAAAHCPTTERCWVWSIRAGPSCTDADLVVGFYPDPRTTTAELNETYTATLTPGATSEFRVDVDARLVADGYAGIESIDCR